MATIISHTAIPITIFMAQGLKKISLRLFLLDVFLAMAPDLDIVGFYVNVAYSAPLGHRGMTHSLLFAAAVAWFLTRYRRFLRAEGLPIFVCSFLSMASHGILDALTNGGLGVAFFWPFSNQRYFFPWHEIQVSQIGFKTILTARGWVAWRSEVVYIWGPCLLLIFLFRVFRAKRQA